MVQYIRRFLLLKSQYIQNNKKFKNNHCGQAIQGQRSMRRLTYIVFSITNGSEW